MKLAKLQILHKGSIEVLLVAGVLFANYSYLAWAPQNPDGAELVMAAIQGGVLHPPGFPVQAWLDRFIVHLFPQSPAHALAWISLVSLSISTAIMYRIGKRLNYCFTASLFSAMSFAFYPVIRSLGLQPEKYALSLMLFLFNMELSLCLLGAESIKSRRSLCAFLGLAFGAALGQHIGLMLIAPLVLAACLSARPSSKKTILLDGAIFLTGCLTIFILCYGSLLLLTRSDSWPDWGKLKTPVEVLRHIARSDLKNFMGGMQEKPEATFSAFDFFLEESYRSFSAFLLLLVPGMMGWFKNQPKKIAVSLVSVSLLSCLALYFSEINLPLLVSRTYLERYSVFSVVLVCLMMGASIDWLWKSTRKSIHILLVILVGAVPFFLHLGSSTRIDFSRDQILDLYQSALGQALPKDAVYVGGGDLEIFYGAKDLKTLRFPLAGDYPWFLFRAIPILDRRFQPPRTLNPARGIYSIIDVAYQKGLPIYSTSERFLTVSGYELQKRGLFWVIQKGMTRRYGEETVNAAKALCVPLSKYFYPIPTEGHDFERFIWPEFLYAFHAAAIYLNSILFLEESHAAFDVENALLKGDSPSDWIAACEKFSKLWEGHRSGKISQHE